MKKFLLTSLLFSLVFCMGELFQQWNPNINSGDVYHAKYEVVPFRIEGVELNGYYRIFSLPSKRILIYKYFDDKSKMQFYETALIYDFNDTSVEYLYKDKKVQDLVSYNSLILNCGSILINRSYAYSIKLRLPDKTFFELFNPETEAIEYRVTRDRPNSVIAEIETGKVLLGSYEIFDVNTLEFTSYDIRFKEGEEPSEHFFPLYFEGELYLYSRGEKYRPDEPISYKKNIFKKNAETGRYEIVATTNIYGSKIMINKDIIAQFGYGALLFSISENEVITEKERGNEHNMHFERDWLTDEDFVLLDDGNVLITSGYGGRIQVGYGVDNVYHDSMELYIVSEDRFVLFKTPQRNGGRKSAKLSNGDILIYDSNDADLFRKKRR